MNRFPLFIAALAWLAALAAAVVPYAGLRGLGVSQQWALGVAAAVALVLPIAWHLLAERRRALDPPSRTVGSFRLALRAAFVAVLVAGGALMTTGPRATWGLVAGALRLPKSAPTPSGPAPTQDGGAAPVARGALEALVPGDATVVVSSAGAGPLRELLTRGRGDVGANLDALAKCGVRIDEAAWLVAARGADRLIAARVPGVDEDRNVYCVAGVLADAGVRITLAADALTVHGLLGDGDLTFRRLDRQTLLLTDAAWRAAVELRAGGQGAALADGPLQAALARVDRAASVWAIGNLSGWDLALDARQAGDRWNLRASSVSREGGERTDATIDAPSSFASALPRGGLVDGAAGLFAIVAAAHGPRTDAGAR